jgi:hypothetical protein
VVVPGAAAAQQLEPALELFGSFGGVAGVDPVRALGDSRIGVHAGFQFDGGVQGERLGVGLGARVWELAPTSTFGGSGLDLFVQGEWRASREASTTLRATAGAGVESADPGRGAERDHTATQGFRWSIGIGREVIAPSRALILLSADLVMPHVNPDIDGRRRPVLELGFAYRSRFVQALAMP